MRARFNEVVSRVGAKNVDMPHDKISASIDETRREAISSESAGEKGRCASSESKNFHPKDWGGVPPGIY